MSRGLIALTLLLAVILTSCAGFKPSEEARLRAELKKWESFKGNGIIEISAMGFSLRKPFALAKSLDEIRLDVIEGGIFGAGASPLLSVYLGEYFALKAPMMPALEAFNLADNIPQRPIALFSSADYIFDRYGEEIIREKAIVRDSLSISFESNYRLKSVQDRKSGLHLDAGYNSRGDIDSIEIKAGPGIKASLLFDELSYVTADIVPLPPQEANPQALREILKDGSMFDILKGLIGN
jgi:hypothetical protein